ncbi:hypothetical protein F503_04573 [Ophiostoma piceae UAMH 11346]|uniref:Duf1770 domain containing protein n=1 Tax=Ophiostoma piceae (strain UAMH 11346) TaxID=1262450 RepID=S3CAN0_OPHP1|nr:hypothetical protein F503_04573 [Ophiostoma piceae UAMH 11346]
MANSLPLQIAETIQTASIRHNPTVERDLAPSTAADTRIPVVIEKRRRDEDDDPLGLDGDDDAEADEIEIDDGDSDENHYSVIRPWDPEVDSQQHHRYAQRSPGKDRPHMQLPPMPDLRFEQSYLRSINAAVAENSYWKVALITIRDQLFFPFLQGLVYNVGICGWQTYNRRATLNGQSAGARVRRWWYGVNNWPVPAQAGKARR